MSPDSAINWGFLTATEYQQLGLIGGYLILNRMGRPLEFHCTTPIRANRAQEILYGTTLDAFLYGEQIAQTLINRAKVKPYAVLTDCQQVLTVQEFIDIPVCFIAGLTGQEKKVRILNTECHTPEDNEFPMTSFGNVSDIEQIRHALPFVHGSLQNVGRYQLMLPELLSRSAIDTVDELKNVSSAIDFLEPFERIRLAIEEAQKAA